MISFADGVGANSPVNTEAFCDDGGGPAADSGKVQADRDGRIVGE